MSSQEHKTKSLHSLDQHYSPSQQLRHLQHLMMTKQMQQAISILQLPVLELSNVISEELEQNPILECEEEFLTFDEFEELADSICMRKIEDDSGAGFEEKEFSFSRMNETEKAGIFLENYYSYNLSLFEFLMNQAHQSFEKDHQRTISEWIIGNLDDFGFLTLPLEELANVKNFKIKEMKEILEVIQTFDPPGIGAQNLQESLLIQLKLKNKENSFAYQIIRDFYFEMTHNKIVVISKNLNVTPSTIQNIIDKEIACLDLHPGLSYDCSKKEGIQAIVPDVFIKKEKGRIEILINEENIPALKINAHYLKLIEKNELSSETQQYIETKIASGKWLLKSIEQRHSTLYRISKEVAEIQEEFIFETEGLLKPLTMRCIAEKLQLNESTVARAIANKYVDCPKGIISLRHFFSNGLETEEGNSISATCVKDLVRKIIQEENKQKPYSDESISSIIKAKGISCARRTVTKYRQELNLRSASQRKQY